MAGKNDLLFDKPKLENGGQSQEAIVVTSPDKQHVNAPTVEDIKKIAKGEAETEGNKSYTKAESDAKFLSKADAGLLLEKLKNHTPDVVIKGSESYAYTNEQLAKLKSYELMILIVNCSMSSGGPVPKITLCRKYRDDWNHLLTSDITLSPTSDEGEPQTIGYISFYNGYVIFYKANGVYSEEASVSSDYDLEFYGIE